MAQSYVVSTDSWELHVDPELKTTTLTIGGSTEGASVELDRESASQLQWQISQAISHMWTPPPAGITLPPDAW